MALRRLLPVVLGLALLVPGRAHAAPSGVVVLPSPAPVNTPVTIVAQGVPAAPCNAFVAFGDGTDVTLINRRLPFTVTHVYRRPGTFRVDVDCGGTVSTTVTVGPPAGLPFSLQRVELRWEDGRGETTVPKDFAGLAGYADILFNGNGQLIARWEVDGRTLAIVHEFLTFGSRVTIRTPSVPPLPTFEPGLHRLTLRVVQPATNFEIPVIRYFVTGAPAPPPRLELVSPAPGATVTEPPIALEWRMLAGAASYRVDVFEEGKPTLVASAVTRDARYAVPALSQQRLVPGGRYVWRVTPLNEAGGPLAESDPRAFVWGAARPAVRAVPRQVLVGLPRGAPAVVDPVVADLEARHGLRRLEVLDLASIDTTLVLFEVVSGVSEASVVRALAADARVRLAQLNYLFATDAGAGDPLASLQYAPAMIGAPAAHARVTGRGVRVAVIDTGVAADHPDLAGRVSVSKDFAGGGTGPEAHGTVVAGVIAALAGNGVGIAGIAPDAEILALRACRPTRTGGLEAECTALALARALDYALLNGARVVNLSLGGPRDALVTRLAARAEALGVVVVAAAGNQGAGAPPPYPAALPSVLAVTAVDARNQLYPAAVQGAFVKLAAPGVEVLSTVPGGRYSAHSGTSLAAAHASAAAALLLQAKDTLSPAALRDLLEATAHAPEGGPNPRVGHGLLDACRAVERVLNEPLGCPR